MKLPRDVRGGDLVKGLRRLGYEITRQRGDHVRMTTQQNGEQHVTIPLHDPIKVGTLADIVQSIAGHLRIDRDQLLRDLRL